MGKIVACLDMGTSKISLLAVSPAGGRFFGTIVTVPSKGIRKGTIIDMERAALSVRNAVTLAEEKLRAQGLNQKIKSVITGISSDSVSIIESYGAAGIGGKQIKEEHIDHVINSAGSVYIPLDRELIHILPVEFTLDGESGIRNPVGLKGFRLEAKVQILTAPEIQIENIATCLENAGLKIEDLVFKPLATARSVLKEQEMEDGVLLLDIGGGNTELIVFKNERICHVATIPVGGNHITNDIAIGLKIPVDEAEKVKIKYGSAIIRGSSQLFLVSQKMGDFGGTPPSLPMGNVQTKDTEIEIDVSRTKRKISVRNIEEIVYPRCEELACLVRDEISKIPEYQRNISGAVLTGGTSLLRGLDALFESYLGMPVRIGYPSKLGLNEQIDQIIQKEPSLSSVAGLMRMARTLLRQDETGARYILSQLRSFLVHLRDGLPLFRAFEGSLLKEGRYKKDRR